MFYMLSTQVNHEAPSFLIFVHFGFLISSNSDNLMSSFSIVTSPYTDLLRLFSWGDKFGSGKQVLKMLIPTILVPG